MDKARVVIVDDSTFFETLLKDMLVDKGFEVVGSAHSLDEVRQVVAEKKPDIVTMDITIPGTDGFECAQAVHQINQEIKIVFISAMMDDELIRKAKQQNAAGFIQKPIDPDVMAATLNRIYLNDDTFSELEEKYPLIFKEALKDTFKRMTNTIPVNISENISTEALKSKGISAVISITGRYAGKLIIDASMQTAQKIAAAAFKRPPKDENEIFAVFGELSNVIAGNACSNINKINNIYALRVAPPSIFHGDSFNISASQFESFITVYSTDFGEILLYVGFKGGNDRWMQNI